MLTIILVWIFGTLVLVGYPAFSWGFILFTLHDWFLPGTLVNLKLYQAMLAAFVIMLSIRRIRHHYDIYFSNKIDWDWITFFLSPWIILGVAYVIKVAL